jgi:putative DNA primase/helicase
MYHAIPTLRENAKAFAQAVAEVVGSQRIGDQVGTLLAGAFAVQAVEPYTVEDCRTLISAMDFTEATEVDDVSDEHNCLNAILQRQVRVEFEMHGATNRTIGELVSIAHNNNTVGGISPSDAADVIGRHGVRVVGGELWIANAHSELSKTLRDTPWSSGHRRLLLRIDGAKTGDKVGRFAGSASRYVSIPMHAID